MTIALRRVEDGAELAIANTGPGIPPELRSRVFERFFRGDASHGNAVEGCGLGLSIAQWIVHAHGGTHQDGVRRARADDRHGAPAGDSHRIAGVRDPSTCRAPRNDKLGGQAGSVAGQPVPDDVQAKRVPAGGEHCAKAA